MQESLHGLCKEIDQQARVKGAQLLIEPTNGGQGALHIEAVRLRDIEGGTKAQFKHQERVFQEKSTQSRHGSFLFAHAQQKGFGISVLGMSRASCFG